MAQENEWMVESVPVPIPSKSYEEKLAQMVEALLAVLDPKPELAEDGGEAVAVLAATANSLPESHLEVA